MKVKHTNKQRAKKEAKLPVISFFTGGGFLDIGFVNAGFNVVWTNENNGIFADMYEYGMSALNASQKKYGTSQEFVQERGSKELKSTCSFSNL
jgi:DNA (cytosine-5)-methyltransferase 1